MDYMSLTTLLDPKFRRLHIGIGFPTLEEISEGLVWHFTVALGTSSCADYQNGNPRPSLSIQMRQVLVSFIQAIYDDKSPVWTLICISTLAFSIFICHAWCVVHPRCWITRYVFYSTIATVAVLFVDFMVYFIVVRFGNDYGYKQFLHLTTLRYFMWETNFTITMLLPTYKFYRQLQHIHMIEFE